MVLSCARGIASSSLGQRGNQMDKHQDTVHPPKYPVPSAKYTHQAN